MHWSLRLLLALAIAYLIFVGGIYYNEETTEPEVRIEYVPEYIERQTTVTIAQYIDRPVPVHNEPGLFEFKTLQELKDYVAWFRTERMIDYGKDQCEDYAYQFMRQAIADGYLVSTELIEIKTGWHMANTVPIGNQVLKVEISTGEIKLYARKD